MRISGMRSGYDPIEPIDDRLMDQFPLEESVPKKGIPINFKPGLAGLFKQ
jgi:hypothetical protein